MNTVGLASPALMGEEKLMRRGLLLMATMLKALLMGSGIAFAAEIILTNGDDTRSGTDNDDIISGRMAHGP